MTLFHNLRVNQVFGANTNVGKTIITTALCRSNSEALTNGLHDRQAVFYLKPVSTGPDAQADHHHVTRFGGLGVGRSKCLFQYRTPVSPHLAVTLEDSNTDPAGQTSVPSDRTLVSAISDHVSSIANKVSVNEDAAIYIETAGGVHSPVPSGSTQAEAYRPLRLPTILVGDSKLGGISSTISAYESLTIRGYDVLALVMFRDGFYENWRYLHDWFLKTCGRSVHTATLPEPPLPSPNADADIEQMNRYYERLLRYDALLEVIHHLKSSHLTRIQNLSSISRRARRDVWWPFVQHGIVRGDSDVTIIDSAYGDNFITTTPSLTQLPSEREEGKPSAGSRSLLQLVFDGSASWWTQSIGHGNSSLALSAAYAAGRYGHVIFAQTIHEPAAQLAERLIHRGPGKGWASRAFFSDNGTTGVEVAIKMATRAAGLRYGGDHQTPLEVIGLRGSYHGDTIGAMNASEKSTYNAVVDWYTPHGFWFDPPRISYKAGRIFITGKFPLTGHALKLHKGEEWTSSEFSSIGDVYDVESRIHSDLASIYRHHITEKLVQLSTQGRCFGALIIEPLIMGAAGMVFVDPLFQRILVDVVRSRSDLFGHNKAHFADGDKGSWLGLPVVFDEVFTGLYRAGVQSALDVLGVSPDISVFAKILTGGLLPLSVTLASSSVFDVFVSERKEDAMLHGHSYTANPIGCAVANKSLDLIEEVIASDEWKSARRRWTNSNSDLHGSAWSLWDPEFVRLVSLSPVVTDAMALGTVFAFRVKGDGEGYTSSSAKELLQSLTSPTGGSEAIHFRTLGDVAYFISSLNTPNQALRDVENKVLGCINVTMHS